MDTGSGTSYVLTFYVEVYIIFLKFSGQGNNFYHVRASVMFKIHAILCSMGMENIEENYRSNIDLI